MLLPSHSTDQWDCSGPIPAGTVSWLGSVSVIVCELWELQNLSVLLSHRAVWPLTSHRAITLQSTLSLTQMNGFSWEWRNASNVHFRIYLYQEFTVKVSHCFESSSGIWFRPMKNQIQETLIRCLGIHYKFDIYHAILNKYFGFMNYDGRRFINICSFSFSNLTGHVAVTKISTEWHNACKR